MNSMLCSRCKKRTAVVFISTMQGNEKHDEGLCLICAKELGVPKSTVIDWVKKIQELTLKFMEDII